MTLRVPLGGDQTLQTEFHEIERRLRKLEKGVLGPTRSSSLNTLQIIGGGSNSTPVDLSQINARLSALENELANLTDPEEGTLSVFGGVGPSASQGLVPDPGTAEPPTGVGAHLLVEDSTWGFPFRGLAGVATSGSDKAQDVLALSAGLHVAHDLSSGNLVTGDADIEGQLRYRAICGSCNGDEINWQQASMVQNTWYAVSDTDISDGDELFRVAHDGSGKLTVELAGKYLCIYAVTAEMSSANNHLKTGFLVSGSTVAPGRHHMQFPTANAEDQCAGVAIFSLVAGAYVEIGVMNPDATTPTVTVDHTDLMLMMLGG